MSLVKPSHRRSSAIRRQIWFFAILLILFALSPAAQAQITSNTNGPNASVSSSTTTSITIFWQALDGATGYEYEQVIPRQTEPVQIIGGNVTSVIVSGLDPTSYYGFRVRAVQDNVKSQYGSTAFGYTKPIPPGNLCYTFSGTTLEASWDADTGRAGTQRVVPRYAIRIDNGNWTDVGTNTSHSFPGLTLGTTYTIDVRAHISDSSRSVTGGISTLQANSNSVPGAPGSPSTSELAANSVKLSWTASSGTVTTYEVKRNGSGWIDSSAADTEHTFSNLRQNTAYTLQVRARNGPAKSAVSNAPSVITLPDAVPGVPAARAHPL